MVSEFGLGCARIGGVFQSNTRGFVELIRAACDAGINFFDTADMYSQGESEALLGRALGSERHRVIIASKAGYRLPGQRRLAARVKPILRPAINLLRLRRDRLPAAVRGSLAQDFSSRYLRKSVEGSLRRLRTDYLDLFQLHSPSLEIVERGEWVPALEDLKSAGKIRHYGIACDTVDVGLAALRHPGVASLQFTLSLLEQRSLAAILPALRAKRVAGIARECLGNGLLVKAAGEIDLRNYCPTADERKLREEQLSRYRREAEERGISLSRMALEFVTVAEGVSVALVGARSVSQLQGLFRDIGFGRTSLGSHP
jgi:aryl-alcohol dehydrogenase-like predicted oxidoreductase